MNWNKIEPSPNTDIHISFALFISFIFVCCGRVPKEKFNHHNAAHLVSSESLCDSTGTSVPFGEGDHVSCPLPTMRFNVADMSCHPSIRIPLISAVLGSHLEEGAGVNLLSHPTIHRFLQRRGGAPTGTLIAKAKGHPSNRAQWGH